MVVSVRLLAAQFSGSTPAQVQVSVESPPFAHCMATVISSLLQFGDVNVFDPVGWIVPVGISVSSAVR